MLESALSPSLDPPDWRPFRAQSHRMLDDVLDYLENIRHRPVWQPIPVEVRARFFDGIPHAPAALATVHAEFMQFVLPYSAGNTHPGFMGWIQGAGTPVGMLAEMLAAGMNANCGGRDHVAIEVERQVVRWMGELFGFPRTASGLFVTGSSAANLLAVVVARDAALGFEVRRNGVPAYTNRLTAYASTAVHSCISQALDVCGIGSGALRLIRADERGRIRLDALQKAILADREAGFTPFLVIGTAGTVETGAIDDLAAVGALAHGHRLWFHVDGALGALAIFSPELAPRLAGIEQADSLACDFHKWGQVPYDAGFLLVRDGVLHHRAFESLQPYLQREIRGLAAGSPWPCDFGPDLSRGFRALKAWFTLKVFGTAALGASISETCALARYLESKVRESPELELLAPVELNIVCFRYRCHNANQVNAEIVIRLQESGLVAPSTTTIEGRLAIRAAITNHRTRRADADALIDSAIRVGRSLQFDAPHHEIHDAVAQEVG